MAEWESRRQTSVEARIEDGFIALGLLPQKGLPGGPAHGRGARPAGSAVCKARAALRLRPRRALSSARAKGLFGR